MRKPSLSTSLVLTGILALAVLCVALFHFALKPKADAAPKSEAAGAVPQAPIDYTDIYGREIRLPSPPQRVISLAPTLTEIIFALGQGDRLVADTRFCLNPPAAISKPKIGGIVDPDVETMLGFHPDLVVCTELTPREVTDQMDRLGMHAVCFRATSIEELLKDIKDLSFLLNVRERGQLLASTLEARIDSISAGIKTVPVGKRPKVLFLFRADMLCSAGRGTFPDELIALAGGINIAAKSETAWPVLSMESVLTANPDVIVMAGSKSNNTDEFVEKQWTQMRADARWQQVSAVANNRLVTVQNDRLTVPGPELADTLELLARKLHPELFKDTISPTAP